MYFLVESVRSLDSSSVTNAPETNTFIRVIYRIWTLPVSRWAHRSPNSTLRFGWCHVDLDGRSVRLSGRNERHLILLCLLLHQRRNSSISFDRRHDPVGRRCVFGPFAVHLKDFPSSWRQIYTDCADEPRWLSIYFLDRGVQDVDEINIRKRILKWLEQRKHSERNIHYHFGHHFI